MVRIDSLHLLQIQQSLEHIAGSSEEFSILIDSAIKQQTDSYWLAKIDLFLNGISWEKTVEEMARLENEL